MENLEKLIYDLYKKNARQCTNEEIYNALLIYTKNQLFEKGYQDGKKKIYYIDNQIRIALASLSYLDKEAWEFVYHNNVYVTYRFLENKIIYSILVQSCIAVKEALANDELEKAYDLLDCIHCLPEIIADNKLKIPKN